MLNLHRKIIITFGFLCCISIGSITNVWAANAPPPRPTSNQMNISPGVIFPTNYNKTLPEAKQPFVPEIEDKTETKKSGKTVKSGQ